MLKTSSWRFIVATTLSVYLVGCYSTRTIKPTELPKLSGGVGGRVEDLDGYTVVVDDEYDAAIVGMNGRRAYFQHPVFAKATETTLEVAGANHSAVAFNLAELHSVETTTLDTAGNTFWAVYGVVTVVGGIFFFWAMHAALNADGPP